MRRHKARQWTSFRSGSLIGSMPSLRKMVAVGGLAVALVGSAAVVAHGDGYPASRVALSGGGAWLASPTQGLVTLIDGASEQVVGSVRAPGATRGDGLSVVQYGASAYMVNETQGTVSRVDGATYEVSAPIRFTGERGGTLGIFAGSKSVYVVDGQRRTASVADPVSLEVRERLSLVAQPGPEQSVVDAGGRLWVLDREKGGLTWFDEGKRTRPETGNQADRLVLVQGRPVLVDQAGSRLGALSPEGTVDRWSCLELRAADRAQLLGSASSDRVFAAIPASGTLVASSIDRDDCGTSVDVGEPGDEFGPLAEASGFVFVPNRTRGRALVVDVAAGRVAGDLPVAKPGSRLELLSKDGFVFYNDLDGDTAGVIRLDGGRWTVGKGLRKFQPSDNGKGILTPAGEQRPSDPAKPPTDPKQPPTNTTPTTPPPSGGQTRDKPPPGSGPDAPPPGGAVEVPPPDNGPQAPPLHPVPTPTPAGSPSASAPSDEQPPPLVPPIIRDITWNPATPIRGRPVTFTGNVADADNATWAWTLTRADGRVVHTDAAVGRFTMTMPTDETDPYTIKLVLTGAGGTATKSEAVEHASAGTPRIPSLTANPRTAAPGQVVTFSAVETVAGAEGVWSWMVYDIGTGAAVPIRGPVAGPAQQPFTHTFSQPGAYQIRLTVTFHGNSSTASTPVDVVDNCTVTPSLTEVDLRGQASETVTLRATGCAGAVRGTVSAPRWLRVPATFTIPAGGSTPVTVTIVAPPEKQGQNLDMVKFTLDNGKVATLDVLAHLAPHIRPAGDGSLPEFAFCMTDGTNAANAAFWADYQDPNWSTLSVIVSIDGQQITLKSSASSRTLYFASVPKSSLPAGVTRWTVQARNQFGVSSKITTGTGTNCW